jgi:predicted N-formylglutamate amidohydrolase
MTSDRPALPAFALHPGRRRDLLLVCDHASNAIPPELGTLGLDEAARQQHVAIDIGAAGISQALARALDCPAIHGCWSRLVVDLNRGPDSHDLIVADNDGIEIPGNLLVDQAERARRIEGYHQPYHEALARHLQAQEADGLKPALLAIHSFTPVFYGAARPWQVGVVWQVDAPWLQPLIAALRAQGLIVGDNEPYDGHFAMGHTLERHGVEAGRRHLMIEVRQDLAASADQQQAWADRLLPALRQSGFLDPGG